MTPEQLSSMNTWLAVIAVASVIQVAALAAVAMVVYRLYAKSREAIDDVQKQIEPVKRQVTDVLDKVNAAVARLRRAGDRVEDSVAAVSHGVNAATSAVKTAVLPGWAVTRGVMAAVSAFTKPGRNGRVRHSREGIEGVRRAPKYQFEESRFVNEGGNDARDEHLRD
jgi:uncharacterized protein YoxC